VGYLPDNTADVFEEVATQINNRYTKEEIANLISEIYQNIDYKEAVDSYAILLTTYPSPEESWVVQVNDEDTTYRFDGLDWINIGSITSMPLSTHLIDGKMSKDDKIKLDGLPSQITAQLVKYTPTGENDWDTIPTNVKDALDELVGRVSIEYDFIRVKITNGDLLDIHTTPLSLIPAAPLGYITQITELFASFHAGTVVFNASELTIGFDNEGDLMHIDDLDTLTSQVWIAVPGIGFSALKLKVSVGLSALVVGTGT
jgi:hypothetical protein